MPVLQIPKARPRSRTGAAAPRTLSARPVGVATRPPRAARTPTDGGFGGLIRDLMALADLETAYDERDRAVRSAENEAASLRALVEELAALLEATREALSALPARDEAAREARARLGSLQAERNAGLRRLGSLDARLRPLGAQRHAAGTRLEAARRGVTARLGADTQRAFESALRSGRHTPVAGTDGSFCSGCRLRLPATLEQQLKRTRTLGSCPQCRRLLYDPAWLG